MALNAAVPELNWDCCFAFTLLHLPHSFGEEEYSWSQL